MKTKYFSNVTNIDELKHQFKKLAKKYHPDLGGSTEIMAEINAEYDFLLQQIQSGQQGTGQNEQAENFDMFREIIMNIIHLPIEIEVCGSWIWVSGNTYPYRETLKENDFKWSRGKKKWYWKPYETKRKPRTNTPMEEIRAKYGSQIVKEKEKRPAATGRLIKIS